MPAETFTDEDWLRAQRVTAWEAEQIARSVSRPLPAPAPCLGDLADLLGLPLRLAHRRLRALRAAVLSAPPEPPQATPEPAVGLEVFLAYAFFLTALALLLLGPAWR